MWQACFTLRPSARVSISRELRTKPVCGWGEEGPAGSSTEIVLDVTDLVNGTQTFCVLAAAARWELGPHGN